MRALVSAKDMETVQLLDMRRWDGNIKSDLEDVHLAEDCDCLL
jgi:hypothetical protein